MRHQAGHQRLRRRVRQFARWPKQNAIVVGHVGGVAGCATVDPSAFAIRAPANLGIETQTSFTLVLANRYVSDFHDQIVEH